MPNNSEFETIASHMTTVESSSSLLGFLVGGIVALVLVVMYFIPAFVAFRRKHNSKAAITALNLLLGWTFLGWVGALVWSLTGNVSVQKLDSKPE